MLTPMHQNITNRLAWHTRRAFGHLALPGVAGISILSCCAIFYFTAVVQVNKVVHSLKSEMAVKQTNGRGTSDQERQQPDKQLWTFYESFLKVKDAPEALERLHEVAVIQGVMLEHGEYHLVHKSASKLARYEMVLTIKSDYMHMRKFLSQALTDMPYVALNGVEIQRQNISDTKLDAQVRMTLFLVEK